MNGKIAFLALVIFTAPVIVFASTDATISGGQAIGEVINMIPLEIRTNAFIGKTSQGEQCRVDIILANSEPETLVVGITVEDENPVNILFEKDNVVHKTFTSTGKSASVTLEKSENNGWKFSVSVPDLENKQLRSVIIKNTRGVADCAIDTRVTDN